MKLVSWNVNGLRALLKQGYWKWFENNKPDIFCIQEIKAEKEQLEEVQVEPKGYYSSFNSSKERKGHAGVATYTTVEPQKVEYDVLPDEFNTQGRLIQTTFNDFILFNVYFPNGGGGQEKLNYKLNYYDAFLEHVEKLRNKGKSIVFCGDLNVAHEEIDLARPKENEKNTGFLPEERAWADSIVNLGYIDTFRHFYPNAMSAYSYWDMKSRARDRNVGWRIDYFFISPDLLPKLKSADILTDVFGSDHCPVSIELAAEG